MWDVLQLETFCWNGTDRKLGTTPLSVHFWFIIAPGFHHPALGQEFCIGHSLGLPFFRRKYFFEKQQKELRIFCPITVIRCNIESKWHLRRKNKQMFRVLLFCHFFFGEWNPFFFFGLMTLFRKVSYETQPQNLNLFFVAMNFFPSWMTVSGFWLSLWKRYGFALQLMLIVRSSLLVMFLHIR